MDIKGHVVKRVWVERASDIAEEYYAVVHARPGRQEASADAVGRGRRRDRVVAASNPDAIVMRHIDPVDGLSPADARQACVDARLNPAAVDGAADILVKLYRCFTEGDCDLAEINPLILRPDGGVHALDAKVSLDNNAAFRHPEWDEYRATEELDEREQLARASTTCSTSASTATVGIIANGAGLAMSTLDVVNQVGGTAANFLDIGGGANADVMAAALEVINFDQNVQAASSSTSSAASRAARRSPRDRRGAPPSRAACADRDPSRRDERRGGPPDPRWSRHP